jgi:hypothetical protein
MLDYYRDGVIDNNRVRNRFNIEVIEKWQVHLKEEIVAYCLNGDQIKYCKEGEIEWMFSHRYGWYELPE